MSVLEQNFLAIRYWMGPPLAPQGWAAMATRTDLSAMPWPRYDWDGNGVHDNGPGRPGDVWYL